jgi:hypothetical protein
MLSRADCRDLGAAGALVPPKQGKQPKQLYRWEPVVSGVTAVSTLWGGR